MIGPFQRRVDGELTLWSSFQEAISGPYDKVSFDLEGNRLILRKDGSWEYWTNTVRIVNGVERKWLPSEEPE